MEPVLAIFHHGQGRAAAKPMRDTGMKLAAFFIALSPVPRLFSSYHGISQIPSAFPWRLRFFHVKIMAENVEKSGAHL
jgi:hypothetical protein